MHTRSGTTSQFARQCLPLREAVAQGADAIRGRAVAGAGLEHLDAHTTGGLRDGVGGSALSSAALGAVSLGRGVGAVRVRRHETNVGDQRSLSLGRRM